ncbi:MAG: TetR/AcrR family transcriptional regulator [Phototrophicaceae bacterium]
MSVREERHEATREKILKAALELIDRDGVNKFSLRAVARKVKYSPAGLYEYFDNKDDLINSLCQLADNKLASYLSRVSVDDLPYHTYMVEMGLAYIRFAREEPSYFRLGLVTQASKRESLVAPADEEGAYSVLLGGVQMGIEQGYFVSQESFGAEQIAYTLWSIVHGMAMLQTSYLTGFEANFQQADREALQRVVSGLMQQ